MNQPSQSEEGTLVLSYLGLRKAVGIIGIALPFVLLLGKIWLDGGGIQDSISAYYYTTMRNYFVGSMFAIAVFLMSYRYRSSDNYMSDLACVFAIGVALFPTLPEGTTPTTAERVVSHVHLSCAGLFFLTLAYFSYFLFTKTGPAGPTDRKRQRNVVYRTCGIVIVLCLVLALLANALLSGKVVEWLHPLFWLESLAVLAFSVSWLIKGEFLLLKDPA
jgi:hypothetical protein